MDDVRKVKSQLTGAKTGIDRAYEIVEEMAARVRGHLAEVDALVLAGLAAGTSRTPRRRRTTTSSSSESPAQGSGEVAARAGPLGAHLAASRA